MAQLTQWDLDHFGELLDGGATHFSAGLVRLIKKADADERHRLAQAYPQHARAVALFEAGEPLVMERLPGRGVEGARACRVCGCTDERACSGGCFWLLPGLCSACALQQAADAGLDVTPLTAAMQMLREQQLQRTPIVAGELPATLPLAAVAAMVNALAGWVDFLDKRQISFSDPQDERFLQALGQDTRVGVDCFDALAAGGFVASRRQLDAMVRAGGAEIARMPAPAQPPIWRPGVLP